MSDPTSPEQPTTPPPSPEPPAAPTPPPAPERPSYTAAPSAPATPAAYPAQPQPAPGYAAYPASPKTNTLAVVSLVTSIAGWFIVPFALHLVGLITGHISLGQIKRTGEGGRGLALAGVIIGWVGVGFTVIVGIVVVVIILAAVANGSFDVSTS